MSIEQLIAGVVAALEANTAALLKSGGAATTTKTAADTAADKPATAGKTDKPVTKGKTYEAKHSKAEAAAAANEVKEKVGVAEAKKLIKDLGYDKMADITKAEDIDKLYEAAQEALGEDVAGSTGDEDI